MPAYDSPRAHHRFEGDDDLAELFQSLPGTAPHRKLAADFRTDQAPSTPQPNTHNAVHEDTPLSLRGSVAASGSDDTVSSAGVADVQEPAGDDEDEGERASREEWALCEGGCGPARAGREEVAVDLTIQSPRLSEAQIRMKLLHDRVCAKEAATKLEAGSASQ